MVCNCLLLTGSQKQQLRPSFSSLPVSPVKLSVYGGFTACKSEEEDSGTKTLLVMTENAALPCFGEAL